MKDKKSKSEIVNEDHKLQKGKQALNLGDKLARQGKMSEAAVEYAKAIKYGNIAACCRLGWMHYDGKMYSGKNISHAIGYFHAAAEHGSGEGFYGLYVCGGYYWDKMSPYEYLKRAAELGYKPALEEFKKKYNEPITKKETIKMPNGNLDDVEFSYYKAKMKDKNAFITLKNMAENNDSKACYFMGMFIQNSGNTEEHEELCLKWYKKSYELGYKKAKEAIRLATGYSRNNEDVCPRCGKPLTIRPGNNGGYFKGCSGFPKCQYTTQVSTPYYGKMVKMSELDCFMIYCKTL